MNRWETSAISSQSIFFLNLLGLNVPLGVTQYCQNEYSVVVCEYTRTLNTSYGVGVTDSSYIRPQVIMIQNHVWKKSFNTNHKGMKSILWCYCERHPYVSSPHHELADKNSHLIRPVLALTCRDILSLRAPPSRPTIIHWLIEQIEQCTNLFSVSLSYISWSITGYGTSSIKGLSPVTRNLCCQSARGNRSGAVRYFPEAVRPRGNTAAPDRFPRNTSFWWQGLIPIITW